MKDAREVAASVRPSGKKSSVWTPDLKKQRPTDLIGSFWAISATLNLETLNGYEFSAHGTERK